jgi:hypothetical protein
MNKKVNEENTDEIKNLISKEEEGALRVFRKTDFTNRLKARTEKESKKELFSPFLFRIPVPALAILAFLLFLGVAALLNRPFPPSSLNEIKAIESFLREAPGFQSLTKEEGLTPGQPMKPSAFELSIQNALALAQKERVRETQQEEERVIPSNPKDFSPQDFYKNLEILIKEKKIELFLSQFLKKSEEV